MTDPVNVGIYGFIPGNARKTKIKFLDDISEFSNSLIKNQADTVYHDTEVLILDPVENMESQPLDGYDTEVVPDSDDEVSNITNSKGLSCRSDRFSESIVRDLCKVKPHSHPLYEQHAGADVNIDACGDEGVSGQSGDIILCDGHDISPTIAQSYMQAIELHLKDGNISEAKDANLGSSVSSLLNCAADNKQLSEDFKFNENDKMTQLRTQKVNIVYTRKRKRTTCTFEDRGLEEVIRSSSIKCDEYARLSDVESQEPEDVSKALLFVDQYVCFNDMDYSPLVDAITKEKSPPALSAKGVQNLARWATRSNKTGQTGIFDWDHSEEQSNSSGTSCLQTFRGNKYGQMYVRRSPSVRQMMSKEHGNPGILQKDKSENSNKNGELKDLANSGARLVASDFQSTSDIHQVHENKSREPSADNKSRESSAAVLDLQVDGESALTKLDAGTIHNSEIVLDVGTDTQMAAEAMRALSFGAPAGYCNGDVNSCPYKDLGELLSSTRERSYLPVWSCSKKTRSASRGKVKLPKHSWKISYPSIQEGIVQVSDLELRRNRGKLVTVRCLDKSSLEESDEIVFMKKSKTKGGNGANMDGCKENFYLVSDEDLPLHSLTSQTMKRNIHPLAGNLDSSDLFNLNEGLIDESIDMKVGPDDEKKEMGVTDCILDLIDQTKNCSKVSCEKFCNDKDMKVTEEGKNCLVVDDPTVNHSVDRKINLAQVTLHDKDKERGISSGMLEVSGVNEICSKLPCIKLSVESTTLSQENTTYVPARSRNWYSRDHPKGKRTCRSMLVCCGKSSHRDYSSVTQEEHRYYPSTNQFNMDSSLYLCSFGSGMRRKKRSSVYINPCWLSSQKCGGRSLRHHVDESWQIGSVYDDDSAANKKQNISKQLTKSSVSMELDKVLYADSVPTRWGKRRKTGHRLMQNEDRKSHYSNHVGCTNCPLINEIDFINVIAGYCEKPGKKKAAKTPLTRELVRLGFDEAMPEFIVKDARRRKTMANVRVLLSQNLDSSMRKQQKKILGRFGIPMASCPDDATHFVTNKFARTKNMLEFIALGKPVVTHMWLESCEQAGSYIDEKNYILRDMKKEYELGFKLPISLDKAINHPLLEGYRVAVTPNTQPKRETLINLVKVSCGQAVDLPTESAAEDKIVVENLLILSCEEDYACCVPFLRRGAAAYSPELLLNGIIIQKLEFKRHQFFTNHVRVH